ncbi:hypothetical protein A3Q56_05660 [Intoshia linei]|uniref:Uncharacterized protein n=1 Tax=Intoshia linei TaxID=1819745 RepID=A0A177AX95_9BILA|nr:hypothetical protein A3Q56_05660 [Intoshia linei]
MSQDRLNSVHRILQKEKNEAIKPPTSLLNRLDTFMEEINKSNQHLVSSDTLKDSNIFTANEIKCDQEHIKMDVFKIQDAKEKNLILEIE